MQLRLKATNDGRSGAEPRDIRQERCLPSHLPSDKSIRTAPTTTYNEFCHTSQRQNMLHFYRRNSTRHEMTGQVVIHSALLL